MPSAPVRKEEVVTMENRGKYIVRQFADGEETIDATWSSFNGYALLKRRVFARASQFLIKEPFSNRIMSPI